MKFIVSFKKNAIKLAPKFSSTNYLFCTFIIKYFDEKKINNETSLRKS